mmetsp:Transcript_127433/g.318154  ORF Transcript_127433/g.318154 Transcript_127433/m.318154 type:complete len:453 (+) Transcript_127433:78-1436(+)
MTSHAAAASHGGARPYHRQVPGCPTIVVRNGFLDVGPQASQDSATLKKAELPRTSSAPADLCSESHAFKAEVAETDIDSNSPRSFGESLRSSPLLGASAASPILGAVDTRTDSSCSDTGNAKPIAYTEEWTLTGCGDIDMSYGPMMDSSWMLPETAWTAASTQPAGVESVLPQDSAHLDEGFSGNCGAAWVSSPPLSCTVSPAFSFSASPCLLAQLSPIGSPQLLPQGAVAVPVPSEWLPQTTWHMNVQVSAPQSQQSSPLLSPKPSPMLGPQLSPRMPQQLSPSMLEADSLFGVPPAGLQAHTIWHGISPVTGAHRIIWTVDAGKLRNHERQAVSPSFELPLASLATSRLVIFPKANADGKGSASFKKSGGWGSVYLKCEASGGSVSFMLSVSDGTMDYVRNPRGPVTHNFADHSTCGLPRDQEQWDFSKAVNHATQTFAVYLDILPSGGF